MGMERPATRTVKRRIGNSVHGQQEIKRTDGSIEGWR